MEGDTWLLKELEESTCKGRDAQGSIVWRERDSYSNDGLEIQSQKILLYYLHFIQKLRHIILEFFQVEPLLLLEKNGGFCKDGPPSPLLL